jgi:hypothetical protein
MTILMNQLFVLARSKPDSLRHFVEFWAERYTYGDDAPYFTNINGPHTKDTLLALFKWKIGSRFFEAKRPHLEQNFIGRLEDARKLAQAVARCEPREIAKRFLVEFKDGGAIYRIFWLHCWVPRLPIYDQHVHRAMTFIMDNGQTEKLADFDADPQIQRYLGRYLAFFDEFRDMKHRDVDKALWQFGKSLSDGSLPL